MERLVAAVFVLSLAGCAAPPRKPGEPGKAGDTKTLVIRWQRLVDGSGGTCRRCASTREEVQKACRLLKGSLQPLGIEVTLEEGTLDMAEFSKDALQSNRIWIGGRPLEYWLGAEVGRSPCCDAAGPTTASGRCGPVGPTTASGRCGPCGGEECRTLTVDGHTYETIPAELVVRSGLIAAGHMPAVGPGPRCCPGDAAGRGAPRGGGGAHADKVPSACCPEAAGRASESCE